MDNISGIFVISLLFSSVFSCAMDILSSHMKNTTLTHEATMIGKKIGKAGFRFHDLRHSYAVAAIRAGDDMKTVSSNLGHASITITMDIYASFTDDMAMASANRMNAYISANF